MSARILSIKSNISKNKTIKIFAKTVTSNFMKSSEKSPKQTTEFVITRSTRFSDNNITNTLASSIRTISQFKSRKKEKPILINLENYHKQFILNKNKKNRTLLGIYTQNGYNSKNNKIKSKYLTINNSDLFKVIKLKKKSLTPSFFTSSSIEKSRNLLMNNQYNKEKFKEFHSNSYFSSIYDKNNQNKTLFFEEISKISKNKKFNSNSNSYSNDFQSNIFKNNFSPHNINDLEPIKMQKESSIKLNILNNIIDKNLNSKYNDSNINQNINESKINNKDKKINHYIGRNHITINDQLAYPSFNSYLFARAKRFENNEQFMYKTRIMVLDKFIKNVNKNTFLKQMTKNESIFEKQVLNQRTLELMKKLFFSYNKTLDQYLRYLFRKSREMNEENERLKQNIIKISMDIEQIRQQIIRGLTLIKEGYSIKFFLMCVKNHTLSLKDFDGEDLEIIENDRLKLNANYYLINKKNKKDKKGSKKNLLFNNKKKRKFCMFPSEKNLNLNNLNSNIFYKDDNNNDQNILENHKSSLNVLKKKPKKSSYGVFDSVEEFFGHFEAISTKLYLLIKENNDKYISNKYLKLELISITKNTEEERKDCILLGDKILIYKQNLEILKIKNKKLSEKLNHHMDNNYKSDVKITLVLKNIYRIYNNIKKKYNVKNIKKEDIITSGNQIYLKIIEDFYLNITNKVLEDKERCPKQYEILKMQIEKKKKEDAFILFQKLIAEKIEIKIDAVLKRSTKVICQRFRKTNDYRKYYRNQNFLKKEKPKNKMELFFEYLDDKDE